VALPGTAAIADPCEFAWMATPPRLASGERFSAYSLTLPLTVTEYNPPTTALSQTCLCGAKKKKPLSQRVHRCGCGIREDRDLFSAYLGLHVRTEADGVDRLDLQAACEGWLHRQDAGESPKSSRSAQARKRRGRRHPPSRRSVARIKARRKAKTVMRQSRSARTSTTDQPTAIAA